MKTNEDREQKTEDGGRKTELEKLLAAFEENVAQVEQVIFIGGATDGMRSAEALEEFFEDLTSKTAERLFGELPPHIDDAIEDQDTDEIIHWLMQERKVGFLLQFATPDMRVTQSGLGRSYSWGCYFTEWFYGDTFTDALRQGFEWVGEIRVEEYRKHEAEKSAQTEVTT